MPPTWFEITASTRAKFGGEFCVVGITLTRAYGIATISRTFEDTHRSSWHVGLLKKFVGLVMHTRGTHEAITGR